MTEIYIIEKKILESMDALNMAIGKIVSSAGEQGSVDTFGNCLQRQDRAREWRQL